MPALLHVPCLRSPTLPLEPQKHYNTPSHVLQRRTPGWHLLILRTGKDENKETGLGPLLRHLQKSAGRQMLRFLLSGTPGKTLLAHTSVCVCVCVCVCRHTSGVCVQIKHTTHRCKEEKLRYEAGLKRKVLSGSTSNRIRFVFASGGIVKKKTWICVLDLWKALQCLSFPSFFNWQLHLHLCVLTETDPLRSRSQSTVAMTNHLLNHLRFERRSSRGLLINGSSDLQIRPRHCQNTIRSACQN